MFKSWIYLCLFGLFAGVGSYEAPEAADVKKYGGIIYSGKTAVCQATIVGTGNGRVTAVTAAHCVRGAPNLSALFNNQTGTISQVLIHPFYKPPLYDYDISVLKIDIDNKDLSPMSLSGKEDVIPEKLKVIEITADQVKEGAEATKESRQTCQSKHGSKIRISTKMICAQLKSSVLSGSALFYTGQNEAKLVLAGVASSSLNSTLPTIYTNIANSQIYKFIDQYI